MLRLLIGLTLAILAVPASAADLAREDIVGIARDAFIWGYPAVDNYNVLYDFALAPQSPAFRAPVNQLSHARQVAGPQDRSIVAPNVDTPYSYAWLDLRAEPVVLTLPAFEKNRYVSLQLIDAYTYIIGYVSPRTNGNGGGRFLVTGPDWNGAVPDGITGVFRSPTDFVLAHYRTQLLGADDLARLHGLQDEFGVETLSAYLGKNRAETAPELQPITPLDIRKQPTSMQFFRVLNWVMQYMPPLDEEKELRQRFASIEIGPGLAFDPDPQTEALIAEGMREGLQRMVERAGQVKSSAELFGSRDFLKQDYLTRAVAAMIGIYGNAAEEFLGVGYHGDSKGELFDGRHRYTITFPKGGFPEVGAFWSITTYTSERFLYPNSLNRYSLNSGMVPGFAVNADGSITLHVQHDSPGSEWESNWLPVPAGPFLLTFRTYLPGPPIRDGSWQAPPVIRQ